MRNPSLLFVLTFLPIAASAQYQSTRLPSSSDLITLDIQPGKQVAISSSSPGVRQYKGYVRLRHQTVLLFCDRAVHELATNSVGAGGHVLLVQNDSLTVKSDSLFYDGASQQAILTGHVVLQNGRSVLATTQLDYNLRTGITQYKGKGRFADGRIVQTLINGLYDVRTNQLVAASKATTDPLHSNVPDQMPITEAATPRMTTQLRESNRPIRLTMSPQPNNMPTKSESAVMYKRQVRLSQAPIQTATVSSERPPDESDLEHLLNRKKRAF
ncbi:OstA-like protein [uncultured Fibrella sp.]|uniref:OstA-like protein n=1 Tax=uncultured Fibrella sp. TaxID=1284596 RepID=UPI0035C96032